MEWPRGEATACKAVYTGSNPVSTSLHKRAIGAVVARFLDTEEVTGSNPVSPTEPPGDRGSFLALHPPKTALGSQADHSGSSMEPNGGNRARRIPFDGICLSILAAGTNTTWIFYCGFLPLSLLSQAFSPSCVVRCSGVLC